MLLSFYKKFFGNVWICVSKCCVNISKYAHVCFQIQFSGMVPYYKQIDYTPLMDEVIALDDDSCCPHDPKQKRYKLVSKTLGLPFILTFPIQDLLYALLCFQLYFGSSIS